MHETLMREGAVLVDGVPPQDADAKEATVLSAFVDAALGSLQKDPTRTEANWKIVKKPTSASVSYDPVKWLYAHTDASIPPHGVPGLLLTMHYVRGTGVNTLTDGFAVANDLSPEHFELLATYGYDAERDFAASRVDSPQAHAKGLVVARKHPILATAPEDRTKLVRVQYNEVFRTPPTVPFDVFPQWFDALHTFAAMIHDPKYSRSVELKAGQILVMNNWRVLHGRAGGKASADRVLVGGTITREAFYSTAKQLHLAGL